MKLTSAGIEKSSLQDIRDNLIEKCADLKGFSQLPSSIQMNLIDESVVMMNEIQDMIVNTMNSISPTYANDYIFNELGSAYGLERKKQSKSTVTLTFGGKAGVIIPEGTQATTEDGSMIFTTTNQTVIRTNGEGEASAEGMEDYTDDIPAGSVSVLVSNILNVDTVTNKTDGSSSTPAETIKEYRERVQNAMLSNRVGTIAYMLNQICSIEGVIKRLTAVRMADGMKGDYKISNIEAVVGGGEDYQVAEAIFNSTLYPDMTISKAEDTARQVIRRITFNGIEYEIQFTRPKKTAVTIGISLSVKKGYINVPQEAMQELLIERFSDYFENLTVGYSPSKYSFDNIIFKLFEENSYSLDIIQGISYVLTIGGEQKQFTDKGTLEVNYDDYFTFNSLELNFTGGEI